VSAPTATHTPHPQRLSRSPRSPWVGVALGAALVVALFLIDRFLPDLFTASLPARAQDGLTLAMSVLIEALPFVVLGVLLSIVVQVWLPADVIHRWLPKRAWARRAVLSLLGMLIPVCECGNVPFARGLMMRGLAPAEAMTFLIAAPIVNPITIITTHQAFGWDNGILVARLIGGFVIANLIGWLFSKHPNQQNLLTSSFAAECRVDDGHAHGRGRTAKSVDLFRREMSTMMPALFIGAAIAGAIAGACTGAGAFPDDAVRTVTEVNDLPLPELADDLLKLRARTR